MAPSAHKAWVEMLAGKALASATVSYRRGKVRLLRRLSGTDRDYEALRDAALLCRQRARRRVLPSQSAVEWAVLARAQLAAADLLDHVSLDLRADAD